MSTTTQPTDAFHAVNNYLGWGDPSGGVWFIGIEEASGWENAKSEQEVISFYKTRCPYEVGAKTDWSKFGHKGKQIRDFTSKIVAPLSRSINGMNWAQYRDQYLWVNGKKVFQANLFPIGKPKQASWNRRFKALFGFGSSQISEYRECVRNLRYPLIQDLRVKYKPQAIVSFGKSCWPEHKRLLHLDGNSKELINGKVHIFEKERVILAPFFGNGHMSDKIASTITKTLLRWRVSLP